MKLFEKGKKKNNKGFSLVELIVVIAIMAVLVGVLAPAYLRYVEKSRISADISACDDAMKAIEARAMDATNTATSLTVTLKKTYAATDVVSSDAELASVVGKYSLKSNNITSIAIVGTITPTTGDVTFELTVNGTAATTFKDAAANLDATINTGA